jgi:glycerol uptake facilitator-like aquaporin
VSHPLPKRVVAEAIGTAMLLSAVVGSGIMGERLAGGNVAIALLANSIATGGALAALILILVQYPARISIRWLLLPTLGAEEYCGARCRPI